MNTTRLSSKGQVILPKALRDARGWRPGVEFEIEEVAEGLLLKPLSPFPRTTIEDVRGCISYSGPRLSIEEMDQAVLEEAKRHT